MSLRKSHHCDGPRPGVSLISFAGGAVLVDQSRQQAHVCNETAGAIWELLGSGLDQKEVATALGEHFGMDTGAIAGDVAAVLERWRDLGLIGDGRADETAAEDQNFGRSSGGRPRSECYRLAGIGFRITGSDPRTMDHLQAVLEHYRAKVDELDLDLEIALTSSAEPLVLKANGHERVRVETPEEMTGAVFQCLIEVINPGVEWLAMIHGAAVAFPGSGAVLLPGAGGSGKSTLAAWLARRGYSHLADDMIALDAPQGRAVRWPMPHSIKRGSWPALEPVIAELATHPARLVNAREVKFVAAPDVVWNLPTVAVSAIIFPTFDEPASARIVQLSMLETVARLFGDRIWFGERLQPDRVAAFIDWLGGVPAFAMRYPTLEVAERCLRSALA